MEIDWFTVVAQIVNFLVLVLVLKWLLYDRITRAIDERRAAIEQRHIEAEEMQQAAEQELVEQRRERQEIEAERDRLLAEARDDAGERRRELLEQARHELERRRRDWRRGLIDDQRRLVQDLRTRAARGMCAATRQALADLADAELEQLAVQAFLQRLAALAEEEADGTLAALRETEGPLQVHSAFELPAGKRSQVSRRLHDLLGDREVGFATDPELVCGIEVTAQGRIVAWNLQDYLAELEREVLAGLHDAEPPGSDASSEDAEERDEGDAGEDDGAPVTEHGRWHTGQEAEADA